METNAQSPLPASGFEDSTRRRVEIRMIFLGLTQAALGEAIGAVEGGEALSQQHVQRYLCGARPWRRKIKDALPQPIERFAAALRVPVEALEPGGPWEVLVQAPDGAP